MKQSAYLNQPGSLEKAHSSFPVFAPVVATGRIVCAYSGYLPSGRRVARHILKCEHLRFIPEEGMQPYRDEPDASHQIWIWYRLSRDPEKLHLLFRGQFDFSTLESEPDSLAMRVTQYLANMLLDDEIPRDCILRTERSHDFWLKAVNYYLEASRFLCNHSQADNDPVEAFHEAFLLKKASTIQLQNMHLELVRKTFAYIFSTRKINKSQQQVLTSLLSEEPSAQETKHLMDSLYTSLKENRVKAV